MSHSSGVSSLFQSPGSGGSAGGSIAGGHGVCVAGGGGVGVAVSGANIAAGYGAASGAKQGDGFVSPSLKKNAAASGSTGL